MYGNAIDLDKRILYEIPTSQHFDSAKTSLSDYAIKMITLQDELYRSARKHQRQLDDEHLDTDRKKGKRVPQITEFEPESYVLVNYPETGFGKKPPHKLASYLKGPMRVISHNGPRYTLLDLTTNKEVQTHVTTLRQFLYDPQTTDPRQIANKDKQLYDVERIISHKGTWTHKKTLKFEVKWVGYDETTLEPWKNLLHNARLHDYVKSHKKTSMLPQKYR